jgi:hypothetical protein
MSGPLEQTERGNGITSNLIRTALLLLGTAMLVLPGGCSLLSTPILLASLREPDPFTSSRPLIADTLLLWPLGFAIALGGLHLAQCARHRNLGLQPNRWLLTTAGTLLLMSAGSTVVMWAMGYLPKMLAYVVWIYQQEDYYHWAIYFLDTVVLPTAALVSGIYLLARAMRPVPAPGAGARRARAFPRTAIAWMIIGTTVVLLLVGLLAYELWTVAHQP